MSAAYDEGQLDQLRLALRRNVAALATSLLGDRNRAVSTRDEWRWGRQGSVRVTVRGPKQGSCADFETGWMGDPFGLVMREQRCGFPEAVEWAANWSGISVNGYSQSSDRQPPRQPSERDLQRERDRAERDALAAAEREKQIAAAQAIWASRLPTAAESIAERYIVLRRGIPLRRSIWPDSIGGLPPGTLRWQETTPNSRPIWKSEPYAGALVLAATTPDGTVTAVQQIYLDEEADNIRYADGTKIKRSRGSFAGISSAIRLPGPSDGPLLLAEGPETGLSVWAATGYETWIAMGSIALHTPPAERKVVVCRDDDKAQSPADKALTRAVGKWRKEGITLTVATPWRVRRQDKSDFNDLIRMDGADAVRERINAALAPTAKAIPVKRIPVADARPWMKNVINTFFSVADEPRAPGVPPPVFGIRVDLGAGKSETARRTIAEVLRQRARDDTRAIAIALPTHALGEEAAAAFEAIPAAREAGLTAGIWRGRRAADPVYPDRTMCLDLDRVDDAMTAGADIEKACCSSRLGQCPFYSRCGYQAQKILGDRIPSVWLVAHESLFHPAPKTIGTISHLIVDERMWDAGLTGHTGTRKTLSVDTLETCDLEGTDGQRLRYLRGLVLSVIRSAPDGPLSRQTLLDVGFTQAAAREAGLLEWALKVDVKMHPAMTTQERKEAVRAAAINRTVRRLAMFWYAIAGLLAEDGPELSGWGAMVDLDTKEGTVRAVELKGRSNIHDNWKAPTLAMDATMDINLLKPYWPNIILAADIAITTPYQNVLQVADKTYAKHTYDLTRDDLTEQQIEVRTKHLRDINATIASIARTFAPGRTVAVTQLVVSNALNTVGLLPDTVDHAHHNAVAGLDAFKNHSALVAVGRTAPPPIAVERTAEALTGRAIEPIEGWYPKVATAYEMASGERVAAETDEHPDPTAEAIRWQSCEAELLQIVGRLRGVNRTEADPATIIIMANTPLPIPVTSLLTAQDLRPDPVDLQLSLGGIAFTNPSHACRAYPELWNNRETAKSALAQTQGGWVKSRIRESIIRGITQPLRPTTTDLPNPCAFRYQLAGPGQKPAYAWLDPSIVQNPLQTVMETLGSVAVEAPDEQEAEPPPEAPAMQSDTPPDATDPVLLRPDALFPPAGANGQRVVMAVTDLFTVRTRTDGTVTIRRFDGIITRTDQAKPLNALPTRPISTA